MANRLRELRIQRQAEAAKASEWTQTKVAEKVGTTQGNYWGWEAGRHTPSDHFIVRLAKVFEVEPDELGF